MKMTPLFLDYCATTPVDSRVLSAMLPFFTAHFGNSTPQHVTFGNEEVLAVKEARQKVRRILHADRGQIVFTSGATESNNLALKGICESRKSIGKHIVSQVTEHASILNCLKHLEANGFEVTLLPVDTCGLVDPSDVKKAIRDDTVLVSIMWANNEIGTIQNVKQIGSICRESNSLFHSDASQAITKLRTDVVENCIDALTLSAHKIYGPKGVGALYVGSFAKETPLTPLLHGGGQENGARSTTLNVPGIVGLGEACELATKHGENWTSTCEVRDYFEALLTSKIANLEFNRASNRLPNISNFAIRGVDSNSFVTASSEIVVSTGSACSFGTKGVSHVLSALRKIPDVSNSSVRVSFGRQSKIVDANRAAQAIQSAVQLFT